MKNIVGTFLKKIFKLETKIAFYPSLLSIVGVAFAFMMYYFESLGVSQYLVEKVPIIAVNDTNTARSLLTTFIGGLVSIMVFSFSLVMLLLNQASSNFSPRILPGLISNRRHQLILGIYISSLLYNIFTLVSIEPSDNKYQLPSFSILIAILAMTLCLVAFIYFIHSISQEIQINNIMDHIFEKSKSRLHKLLESENDNVPNFPETSDWSVICSVKSGYFQDININALQQIASTNNLKLEILPIKGQYILQNNALFKSDVEIESEVEENIRKTFRFSRSELIEDNYLLAFKQITEVAVKAMSPGINDPGTALNAIDYLTELFALRLQKNETSIILNKDDAPLVKINTLDFNDLLFQVMAALRTYCSHDIIIIRKLFSMLNYLKDSKEFKLQSYKDAIVVELNNLYEDAKNTLCNKADLMIVEQIHTNI